jgi:hypothetical protein
MRPSHADASMILQDLRHGSQSRYDGDTMTLGRNDLLVVCGNGRRDNDTVKIARDEFGVVSAVNART